MTSDPYTRHLYFPDRMAVTLCLEPIDLPPLPGDLPIRDNGDPGGVALARGKARLAAVACLRQPSRRREIEKARVQAPRWKGCLSF